MAEWSRRRVRVRSAVRVFWCLERSRRAEDVVVVLGVVEEEVL